MHSFPYFFLWFGHRLLQASKWGYSIPCFIDPDRDSCYGALSSLRPPLTVDLTGPARRRRGSRSRHPAWDPFSTLSFSSTPPYISLFSLWAILEFPDVLQSSFRGGGCGGFSEHLRSGQITCETKQCTFCHSRAGESGSVFLCEFFFPRYFGSWSHKR